MTACWHSSLQHQAAKPSPVCILHWWCCGLLASDVMSLMATCGFTLLPRLSLLLRSARHQWISPFTGGGELLHTVDEAPYSCCQVVLLALWCSHRPVQLSGDAGISADCTNLLHVMLTVQVDQIVTQTFQRWILTRFYWSKLRRCLKSSEWDSDNTNQALLHTSSGYMTSLKQVLLLSSIDVSLHQTVARVAWVSSPSSLHFSSLHLLANGGCARLTAGSCQEDLTLNAHLVVTGQSCYR